MDMDELLGKIVVRRSLLRWPLLLVLAWSFSTGSLASGHL